MLFLFSCSLSFSFFFICVKGLTKELQKKAFPFPFEPPPPAVSWATEPQAMPKNCTPNHKEESLSLFAPFQAVLKKHRPFWMFPQICTRQMQATRCLAGEEAHRLYFIRFRGSETKFEFLLYMGGEISVGNRIFFTSNSPLFTWICCWFVEFIWSGW